MNKMRNPSKGKTFMLDMGISVKVADVEILINTEKRVRSARYPRFFMADQVQRNGNELEQRLTQREESAPTEDNDSIYQIFRDLNIENLHKTVAVVG